VGVEGLGGECFWAVSQSHFFHRTLLLCCKTASGEVFSAGPEYQCLWKGLLWRIPQENFKAAQNFFGTETSSPGSPAPRENQNQTLLIFTAFCSRQHSPKPCLFIWCKPRLGLLHCSLLHRLWILNGDFMFSFCRGLQVLVKFSLPLVPL